MDTLLQLFVGSLNLAVAASWLIAALLLLRPLLKRLAPKWVLCALWALVAVRLVCPVALQSDLSVYRLAGDAVQASGQVTYFRDTGFCGDVSYRPATLLPGVAAETPSTPDSSVLDTTTTADAIPRPQTPTRFVDMNLPSILWAVGIYVMLMLALAGYLSLREDTAASIPLEGGVYLCDGIKSPFILGMFRPRIYLTSGMDEAARVCVLRHEKAHLRRGDHIWKPLGFLLLAVYWYDPLVWAAYILFCRDMELACDERVIRDMAAEERAAYSQALLDCSRGRHWVAACPLAFGEVGVKTRVKAVLWYKKPAFWAVLAAVAVCAVVAVCFLTNPKGTENEESDQSPASYQNVALVAYQTDTVTLTGYAGDVETTSGSTLGKLLSNADWTFLREGRADDGTDEDYTILAQVNDDTTLRFYAAAPGESTVKITAGDESRWYNMGEMGCADVRRALTQTDTLLLKLAAQAEEMDTFDMTWAYGDTLYTDNGIPAPVLTRFLRSEVWQPIESIDEASFQLAALLEIGDSTLYFYEDTLERNNLSFSVSNVIVSSGGAEHVYSIADSSFRDWLEGDARYLGQTGEEPETVLFGSYEQDGDAANGKEPIEWLVLARDGDKALLLSKYALDHQSFMPFYEPVTEPFTWESCSLRQWLNSTFLNAAFSAEEQRHRHHRSRRPQGERKPLHHRGSGVPAK